MMIRTSALFLTLLATAASAVASVLVPPAPPEERRLLVWTPGDVRCDGQSVTPVMMAQPRPGLSWLRALAQPNEVSFRFRIDGTGRPLSISLPPNGYLPASADLGPSLAATRFPAGAAKANCTIVYTLHASSLAESAPRDLATYIVESDEGPLPIEGWRRVRPDARGCLARPQPSPLLRAFPDFDRIAATPGVRDWTMIGYDLDRRGHPVGAKPIFGSGNAALDAAGAKAVRQSRFTGGPRTGCFYPYWRAPKPLAAPPAPDKAAMTPANAQCVGDDRWATPPALIYPQAYNRRSIEGWAVIGFDVAPWGEAGNLHVLASEPAAAFGEQAVQMMRVARKAPSPSGRSGCVELVRFVIAPKADASTAG